MFAVNGLNHAHDVWSRCGDALLATAPASLLIGLLQSEFYLRGVYSTIGTLFLAELCVAKFCGWGNCGGSQLL